MTEPLVLTPPPASETPPSATLEGVVQRVVHTSPDGEFAVIRLEVAGAAQPVVAIGPLAHVNEGETVQISGAWETHPQYGRRLRATMAVPKIPQTAIGIERYLTTLTRAKSGNEPSQPAKRLVEAFGLRALEVLETEPWRAAIIKGVGKRWVQRAAAAAKARKDEREVMVFLQGHGISAAYATRIRKVYGDQAMVKVRENPYRLARDVPGIGFQIADRIAQQMGISPLSSLRLEAGLTYTLESARDAGHCYLPAPELCQRACDELRLEEHAQAAAQATPPVVAVPLSLVLESLASLGLRQEVILEEGEAVYLRPMHRAETGLARRLRELRQAARDPVPALSAGAGVRGTVAPGGGPSLTEGQLGALRMIEESPVCVITGGPGTGKTTIIRTLVRAWEADKRKVLLAAPTGRAAKRLSEATGRPASTVHRLLEWAPTEGFRRRGDHPLEVDLLVCDEASMLDLSLARALAQAVPRGATLLLVGDVDQLPSVGPGRVLSDIIESEVVPVARLNEIFRQAEGSGIVENAHRIRGGRMPTSAPRGEQHGDFYLIEANEPERVRDLVLRVCTERIPQRFGLDPLRDVQVLTPMHRGEVGTEELNRSLQQALNPPVEGAPEMRSRGRTFRRGDKVMQVKNDYDRDVWNGDVGIVTAIVPDDGEVLVSFDDREVVYSADDLDQLELAYAISVHKSQGSEYLAVVVPLVMQHYVLLRRNLLYTAVTRGKRLVVLVGSQKALWRATQEQGDLLRYTRLAQRLQGKLPS